LNKGLKNTFFYYSACLNGETIKEVCFKVIICIEIHLLSGYYIFLHTLAAYEIFTSHYANDLQVRQ